MIENKLAYIHTGGISGFSSIIAIFPESEGFIMVLSNREGEASQLNDIVKQLAKKL
jgi:hypothetical protein